MTTRIADDVRAFLAAEIEAAEGNEVSFVGTFDADGDVVAARVVARGSVDSVLALPGVAERGEILLHNHPSGLLDPSRADLNVAVRLHDGGVGFGIVDNTAADLYVVVEVPKVAARDEIDPVAVAHAFTADGPIAASLGRFEHRQCQRDMAAYVADIYNEGGTAIIEAGTGVGKSLAYLVPALEWARVNGERTIVSTNTINLQEQLVGKDLPLLVEALGETERRPTYALLKGWRNYLCLLRLERARDGQQSLFEGSEASQVDALAQWAAQTTDGSLSDLTDNPSDTVWDEVAAESDLCLRLECPHFDKCFVFKARREAAEADVVVVNHHLLASDLAVRLSSENWQEAAVLPPYHRAVIDEAHHLEDTMAQHLGVHVSSVGVERLLGRLERNGRGLLATLLAQLAGRDDDASELTRDTVIGELAPQVNDARRYARDVFGLLERRIEAGEGPMVRLTDAFSRDPIWSEGLEVALENLVTVLGGLREGIEKIAGRLELDEPSDRAAQMLAELRGVLRRLVYHQDGLISTLRPRDGGGANVRWVERRGKSVRRIALASVPLDLGSLLRDGLFERVDSITLTSATLSIGGDFDYLERRLGLDVPPTPVRIRESLPSPFEFEHQCLLGVPMDAPDPKDAGGAHDEFLQRAILELTDIVPGGILALFTSHGQLQRVAAPLRKSLGGRRAVFVQGDAPRHELLQRFRDAGTGVLFGTDSFWEGVDVPGGALRALVLAKLPFKVPSDPLTAAHLERVAAQGGDGFRDYLLPNAALKLKQGFGRLIRNRTDWGVVIVADRRLVTKRYGSTLLEGLPPAPRELAPWRVVRDACSAFFERQGREAHA